MKSPDPEIIAAAISAARSDGWSAWRSDTGRWWAARTTQLAPADVAAGRVPYVCADDPADLLRLIDDQDGHAEANR